MYGLLKDIRYGIRSLLKRPGFTLVAVITLALGIGASTTLFSIVNAVLLRPLPYPEADRLVHFASRSPSKGVRDMDFTDHLFAFYRDRSHSFESVAVYDSTGFNFAARGEPERLAGATVTYDFFRVLGKQPLLGRSFLPQEDTQGNNNVAVLSFELWQRRFAGDPKIVGQSINLNNIPAVIVGVMPPRFDFPEHTDLWVPLGLNPQTLSVSWHLNPIGRLKSGVTNESASREVAALWDDYVRQMKWPKAEADAPVLVVIPLADRIVGDVRTPLLVLLAAVGVVLLIACANIANLLLARGTSRRREIAVRCCLGASSARIVRQLLTESLLLALIGTAGGLFLAFWSLQAIKALPPEVPRIDQVQIDPRVLFFTFAVAVFAAVLFGLVPALQAARVNLNEAMKDGARSSAPPSTRRLSSAFVMAQIGLSVVLLVGAALLLQSFRNLLLVDPGFRPANLLTARLELPSTRYPDDIRVRNFYEQLIERLRPLPGVRAVGLCQWMPLSGNNFGNNFTIEGPEPGADVQLPIAWTRDVTPGYFAAMGIPILSGEAFRDADTDKTLPVAIVSDNLARKYWPGENPIGKRIRIGRASWGTTLMTVIGVVPIVKSSALDEDPVVLFYIYRPFAQNVDTEMNVVIRADRDANIGSALRRQVSELDAELPLFDVRTMEQTVAETLGTRRLTNFVLAAFAFVALLLAALGVYGVIALNVNNRINEFGIRLALGAKPGDVLWLVLGQGLKLTLAGTLAGIVASLWLTRAIEKLLFGVKAADPLTYIIVAVALVTTALLACYIPARRATKVDPLVALRYE